MSYHWIIPLAAAISTVALALFVHRAGPRTELRAVFTFGAITLAFWNLIYVVFNSVGDRALAFDLARIVRSGAMFLFPAVLHLTLTLPGRPRNPWLWRILAIDYALFCGLVGANAFDLLVEDLRVVQWGYYSVGTPLYNIFTALVLANFAAVFALLIYEYRTTTEARMRLQLKFWLFGMAIALPLGLTNLLPAYGIPVYPLGNLGSAAWAGIVAYAIVRHRLMDIEIVVSKGIAYFGVVILLIGPAFLIGVLMERVAFGEVHYDFSAGLLILLLATGVLFPFLRSRAEARVERSLFPQKQASRESLVAFARSVIRILDRDRLIRECSDKLHEVFGVDLSSLFLVEDTRGRVELRRAVGAQPTPAVFGPEHPFVRWLSTHTDCVLRDEVEHAHAKKDAAIVAQICRENSWEVIVPLATGSTLVGFVGLGARRDLQAFTAGDLDLLNSVAAQASIAFENARLYDELRRSREIINRAGRLSALGTLAAGIAHEIRNPLVSIQTFFQLAPQRLGDEEFMTSFLRLAETEVQRISNLISELLSFAKGPATNVGEVDVGDVVERTMTLLAPQARTLQIQLFRHVADMAPLLADSDQVLQVLINIVLNAIQATPAGGAVSVEARVVDNETGPICQIEIRDNGPGIPAEIREAIFNPFFTTKDKGTGLGLPIAHRIVAEAGGFITVESVQGVGSRFLVHLPLSQPLSDVEADTVPVRTARG